MSKVTSKLQVTIPKAIADAYGIAPGTDVVFKAAGDAIRVCVEREPGPRLSRAARLSLFRESLRRVRRLHRAGGIAPREARERGWTRDELYGDRGVPR